jgi:Alw26I/Eco31I/Esp3I family type II restriction m6 adenine DNA methyltransferase
MDQNSLPLRQWMLKEATPQDIANFPAEAKLFEDVDQDSVASVFRKAPPVYPFVVTVTRFDQYGHAAAQDRLEFTRERLEALDSCIPVSFGRVLLDFSEQWARLGTVGDLEGDHQEALWLGRELDETRHAEFLARSGRYAFLKGRMIGRYEISEWPIAFVREDMRRIPDSASRDRIAWRDVARRSQTRRMYAVLIPPGVVTGNSLHVAFFRDNDLEKLRALLVIMNSIPFEFQVRARLGTGHISLGAIRQVHIPTLDDGLVTALSSALCDLEAGIPDAEAKLEVMAALAYGLNQAEYEGLLHSFERLPKDYVSRLLSHPSWRNSS